VVSVEGVEARAVTGADGSYYIEDEALAPEPSEAMTLEVVTSAPAKSEPEPVEISVLAPGYEPTAVTKSVAEGRYARSSRSSRAA
jgi:hypothetical protein